MKYFIIILISILCTILSSCKDEILMIQQVDDIPENLSTTLTDDDLLYLQQTDKTRILYSLIYWDNEEKRYILDLSETDRETLGIESSLYEEATRIINQLNTLN